MCAAWLVVCAACSDDGLAVQNLNSSTSSDSAAGETSGIGTSPLTTGQGGDTGTGDAGLEGTTQSEPETATANDTVADESTASATGSVTTSEGGTSEGGTTEGGTTGGTTEGTASEGSTTEGSTTTGGACMPITADPSGIGLDCGSDLDCLPGYTCQPFEGFVFQTTCQILCTEACECPVGLACLETADKSGSTWYQCG